MSNGDDKVPVAKNSLSKSSIIGARSSTKSVSISKTVGENASTSQRELNLSRRESTDGKSSRLENENKTLKEEIQALRLEKTILSDELSIARLEVEILREEISNEQQSQIHPPHTPSEELEQLKIAYTKACVDLESALHTIQDMKQSDVQKTNNKIKTLQADKNLLLQQLQLSETQLESTQTALQCLQESHQVNVDLIQVLQDTIHEYSTEAERLSLSILSLTEANSSLEEQVEKLQQQRNIYKKRIEDLLASAMRDISISSHPRSGYSREDNLFAGEGEDDRKNVQFSAKSAVLNDHPSTLLSLSTRVNLQASALFHSTFMWKVEPVRELLHPVYTCFETARLHVKAFAVSHLLASHISKSATNETSIMDRCVLLLGRLHRKVLELNSTVAEESSSNAFVKEYNRVEEALVKMEGLPPIDGEADFFTQYMNNAEGDTVFSLCFSQNLIHSLKSWLGRLQWALSVFRPSAELCRLCSGVVRRVASEKDSLKIQEMMNIIPYEKNSSSPSLEQVEDTLDHILRLSSMHQLSPAISMEKLPLFSSRLSQVLQVPSSNAKEESLVDIRSLACLMAHLRILSTLSIFFAMEQLSVNSGEVSLSDIAFEEKEAGEGKDKTKKTLRLKINLQFALLAYSLLSEMKNMETVIYNVSNTPLIILGYSKWLLSMQGGEQLLNGMSVAETAAELQSTATSLELSLLPLISDVAILSEAEMLETYESVSANLVTIKDHCASLEKYLNVWINPVDQVFASVSNSTDYADLQDDVFGTVAREWEKKFAHGIPESAKVEELVEKIETTNTQLEFVSKKKAQVEAQNDNLQTKLKKCYMELELKKVTSHMDEEMKMERDNLVEEINQLQKRLSHALSHVNELKAKEEKLRMDMIEYQKSMENSRGFHKGGGNDDYYMDTSLATIKALRTCVRLNNRELYAMKIKDAWKGLQWEKEEESAISTVKTVPSIEVKSTESNVERVTRLLGSERKRENGVTYEESLRKLGVDGFSRLLRKDVLEIKSKTTLQALVASK